MTAVALCSGGLEKLVSNEIRKLAEHCESDFRITGSGFGKVRFETDLAGIYYALLSLRAVDRLLLETAVFPAADFDELFEGTRAAAWEDYIPKGMGLVVGKVRSNRSRLAAETTIQAMVHKAAAGRLCGKYGQTRLPDSGPAAELRVYIEKDKAQILLDLCGKPLFKRGYRVEGGTAPLRESTAAALILQSLWRRKYPLYDPFCGSGTIALEAALYAWDAAPGLGRRFAISSLAFASEKTENEARTALIERIDLSKTVMIYGSDSDSPAVETAKANLARVVNMIESIKPGAGRPACSPKLWWRKMEEAKAPACEGFIITNPPYGTRLLDKEGAEDLYRSMAILKTNFPSWKINVLSAHAGFESFFGSSASRVKKITSGALETYFYEYDSRKQEKETPPPRLQSKRGEKTNHASKTYTW
ncbi:MAG: class I SAM-dependent RNA methyltransferase [Spirochaetaceae bacterium]|jgi:putative N6-adenine-specific DNA methylase|nr:class I SAM-dependent RNA methyltransferase [Spirochaetaceae bacterium]